LCAIFFEYGYAVLNRFRRIYADNGKGDVDFGEQEMRLREANARLTEATQALTKSSEHLNAAAVAVSPPVAASHGEFDCGGLLEVSVVPLEPTRWEWRVSEGDTPLVTGFETSRETAQIKGDNELFKLLSAA
jgi:hypothetical protein